MYLLVEASRKKQKFDVLEVYMNPNSTHDTIVRLAHGETHSTKIHIYQLITQTTKQEARMGYSYGGLFANQVS